MDSPTGSSDRTLSAHDAAVGNGSGNGDVTPKAENGHAKATKAAKASFADKHGSPPASAAVGAHSSGDGSGTPQLMPSQPSSPAKFKNKPAGKL